MSIRDDQCRDNENNIGGGRFPTAESQSALGDSKDEEDYQMRV
jgi:hypothetical protein